MLLFFISFLVVSIFIYIYIYIYILRYHPLGTVPVSLCDIVTLYDLYITYDGTNHLITCAPSCLTSVISRYLPSTLLETCPSSQDDALCGLIAATNIESIASQSMWSCNTNGLTNTDPCSTPQWSGITCDGGMLIVTNINLASVGLAGMIMINHLICRFDM